MRTTDHSDMIRAKNESNAYGELKMRWKNIVCNTRQSLLRCT